ncbi:hypothetical protein A1A1_12152 [Planococcus antarcticus DSM 14505]|uniref:RiboL-PSP-HEPN domain-containing protein n=1 Tax=Planococcus antarcticus DSM 14505 TaxID=1185653 RepID=A0AA87LUJ8_9BACL|nr:Swt1 family HEPN domain-containing protein [Planococcus antarcticus]EIM06315.1 hypothetical protein A1A1_12152 [Planococcus antarcticus DSM 14505]
MKVAFKFIEPKVDVTENYLENVSQTMKSLFDDSYTISRFESNVLGITKFTQFDNSIKTTAATLHLIQTIEVTYLDVQINISHQQMKLDIEVAISAAIKEYKEADPIAEEMKVVIKESLINDWEKCVWIFDNDAMNYSKELYSEIYTLENSLRQFIDELLTRKLGISWWDTYVGTKTKKDSIHTRTKYIELAPFFNDINLDLMSINIDDLKKIINTGKDYNKVQSAAFENNLWNDIFYNYFSDDISVILESFADNRNHVVHNKLIDAVAYSKIKDNLSQVFDNLNIAREKYFEEIRGEY